MPSCHEILLQFAVPHPTIRRANFARIADFLLQARDRLGAATHLRSVGIAGRRGRGGRRSREIRIHIAAETEAGAGARLRVVAFERTVSLDLYSLVFFCA